MADVTEGLSNESSSGDIDCPYNFLKRTVGYDPMVELYETNDLMELGVRKEEVLYNDDYSNVIPLIELLPVSPENK